MKKLIKLWLKFRLFWSRLRWRKAVTQYEVEEHFDGATPEELIAWINNLSQSVYQKFEYTYDNASELFDSVKPPAQCYKEYKTKLYDDCDGYHACLYHILQSNGIECYLATAVPTNQLSKAHTFLLARMNSHLAVIDYTKLTLYNSNNAKETTKGYYEAKYGECIVQVDKYDYNSKCYYEYKE